MSETASVVPSKGKGNSKAVRLSPFVKSCGDTEKLACNQ